MLDFLPDREYTQKCRTSEKNRKLKLRGKIPEDLY
jgi:hypothetical protein